MTTQTAERLEVHRQIDGLPDSAMGLLGEFVDFLHYREARAKARGVQS